MTLFPTGWFSTIGWNVKDYDAVSLWEVYFKRRPELAGMIERRDITGLDELEYRAAEYFERYVPKSVSGVQGKATTREQKPRRQACSSKQCQRILSGVWGIPNKQR